MLKTRVFSILKHFKAKQQHLFPNFSQNAANFPNPKGPGPIPKMVKKNTVHNKVIVDASLTPPWSKLHKYQKYNMYSDVFSWKNIINALV